MTSIDFRTLPSNVPSLCIPRTFPNIDEKRIRRIFTELDLGEILRIDIVSKTTEKGDKFNRVFVHFKKWASNDTADAARERLMNGKEIKIIYDDPWFWKISAYREPVASKPRLQKKASILLEDEEEEEEAVPRKTRFSNRDFKEEKEAKESKEKEDNEEGWETQK